MRPANFRPTLRTYATRTPCAGIFPHNINTLANEIWHRSQLPIIKELGLSHTNFGWNPIVFLRNREIKYPRLIGWCSARQALFKRYVYIDCFATFFERTLLILCTAVAHIFVYIWKEMPCYKRQTFQLHVCYSFNHIIRKCLILWTRTSKCSCRFQRRLT